MEEEAKNLQDESYQTNELHKAVMQTLEHSVPSPYYYFQYVNVKFEFLYKI